MESDPQSSITRRLRQEILLARERIYHFSEATPLENIPIKGLDLWIKREDLSPIKAYKWRGACNRIAALSEEERKHGIVTASAGNHAQGVALAAAALGINARIHMPRPTPQVKLRAVQRIGGKYVEILLAGDSYDEAASAAHADAESSNATYIEAYDDLLVMGGQGTIADEVVLSGKGPFDVAYLQIGGGGMASGVAEWLHTYWPDIEIIGVEGKDQASMQAAIAAKQPTRLPQLDIFCDGTAVRKAGNYTYEICRKRLSRIVTISNDEVIHAIRVLWENLRCIAEPSGAMGLAAALKEKESLHDKRVLLVLTGANLDFLQLGQLAATEAASAIPSRTIAVNIPEKPGSMLALLQNQFAELNIVDFQYGKTDTQAARPIFSLQAPTTDALNSLSKRLDAAGLKWQSLDQAVDVLFRAIPLRGDLLSLPVFLRLDFYERPGALSDFLEKYIQDRGNLCYFNYRHSGERIGRALIGIEFPDTSAREQFISALPAKGEGFHLCQLLDADTTARLIGYAPEK